jgi:hypothetical protein
MLRLRSLFIPQPDKPWTATYEMRLGHHRFTTRISDGQLIEMRRGEPHDRPDTIIETDPATLAGVLGVGRAASEAVKDGRMTLTGDSGAGHRLLDAART